MSKMRTSSDGRHVVKKVALGILGVTGAISIMGLLGRIIIPMSDSEETPAATQRSFDFEAVQADDSLSAEVLDAIAAIDSYSKSRSGGSYQLHVLVNKMAEFEPVGFQLVDSAKGTRIYSGVLALQSELSCLRVDLKDAEGNAIYDGNDPYTSIRKRESVAYNSETISLAQPGIDSFANVTTKKLNLLVRSGDAVYLVAGLKVSGQCTWFQD